MSISETEDRPGITVTDTGVSAPDAAEVRQYGIASFKGAFGQDLDTSPYTPQGQLIDTGTAIIHDKNYQLIDVLNQFDPEKNDGIWQEGIGKIYFITRKPGVRTQVPCRITGSVGVTIPAGEAQAIDKDGNLYALRDSVTIRSASPVPVTFVAMEDGPIVCPAGSLNHIYKRANGWDTVINETAGITGSWPESRLAFERRRYDSVAKNGHGNVSAVWGAIANLDNVVSVYVAENVKNVDQIIRGVLVHGHSMFISVVGGAEQEIARTVYERKDGGCGYDGNTPIVIEIPTYNNITLQKKTIVINRPQMVRCAVKVQIATTENTPGNIDELIKDALQQNWAGLTAKFPRVEIGDTLLASRFYCAISHIDARMFDLIRVRVGRVPESGAISWGDAVGFTLNEYPSLDNADVHIVEGADPDDVGPQGQFFHYDENGRVVLNRYVIPPIESDDMFTANEDTGSVTITKQEDAENVE